MIPRRSWIILALLGGILALGCTSNTDLVSVSEPEPAPREVLDGPVYKVGVVPQWGTVRLFEIWQPLIVRLRQETGLNLKLEPVDSIPNFEKGFSEGAYDFAYMNPYHFVCAQRDQGYLPLVRDYEKQLKGILVASTESDIRELDDLEGQPIDFPSPNALGASLYMRALLTRQFGIEYEAKFVKTHESVYLNVISGTAAAGGGVGRTLGAQQPEVRERLRVIYETPGVAPHPIAYHPRVPAEAAERMKNAILTMSNTESGKELLAGIPMVKPGEAVPEDYKPLIDLGLEEFYQAPQ